MKRSIKIGTSMLFIALMLLSITMVPALGSSTDKQLKSESDIKYTEAELQEMYVKYSVSDNDVKFAKGKLPNFLDGTILRSNVKVLVTEDGKPLEGMKEGVDYEVLMTEAEMFAIIEKAEKEYIEKYGVDPANPKVDIVNGQAIPVEEVKRLVENNEIAGSDLVIDSVEESILSTLSLSSNPKAVNDVIYVHIYPAYDSSHAPTQSYSSATYDATNRFEDFGIDVIRSYHYNVWDASDVGTDASDALHDLEDDCSYIRDNTNDIVLGWANYLSNNGIAYHDGAFAVCAVQASGADWPHDSIVQHEISHNFGASDQNSVSHPTCIMNYAYAYAGTNVWCTSCGNTVDYGIFN